MCIIMYIIAQKVRTGNNNRIKKINNKKDKRVDKKNCPYLPTLHVSVVDPFF